MLNVITSVGSALLWGVIVLSVLVFIHEGGHYLAARLCGLRVSEFFLGLPCPLRFSWTSKSHATTFGVTAFLLGGYTDICGMTPVENEDELARVLTYVTTHGRVTVPETATHFDWDEERVLTYFSTLVEWGSLAPFYDEKNGEQPDKKVWPETFVCAARDSQLLTVMDTGHDPALNDAPTGTPVALTLTEKEFFSQESKRTWCGASALQRIFILLAGPVVNIIAALLIVAATLMIRGVDVANPYPVVGTVEAGSLAEAAGVLPGDTITTIATTPVETWDDLAQTLKTQLQAEQPFELTVERNGAAHTLSVVPTADNHSALGIRSSVMTVRLGPLEAIQAAFTYAGQVAQFAARLLMPQHTLETLNQASSVVGISAMASEAAASGIADFALLAAAISMSLGFMNLLPIPPLDGGKIIIEAVQGAVRKKIPLRAQNVISYVGLALLLAIFVFALRNDVVRLLFS